MLMTYAAAFLVLFLGMLSVLALRKDRRRLGRLAAVGAAGALVCIAVHVLLFLTTGFDPVKTFQAAIAFDQEAMAKNDGSPLRSLNVGVANLAAFLASVGVPVTVAWAGEIGAAARRLRLAQEGDLVLLGYVASLVLIAFSTLFTLEVERVWLFMAPFVAAPAAHYLHGRYLEGDRSALRWTFGLLALQLVAFEALLRTPW
jgi:amino acid transporter